MLSFLKPKFKSRTILEQSIIEHTHSSHLFSNPEQIKSDLEQVHVLVYQAKHANLWLKSPLIIQRIDTSRWWIPKDDRYQIVLSSEKTMPITKHDLTDDAALTSLTRILEDIKQNAILWFASRNEAISTINELKYDIQLAIPDVNDESADTPLCDIKQYTYMSLYDVLSSAIPSFDSLLSKLT